MTFRTLLPAFLTLTLAGTGLAQSLYKYRGPNGEWVFTDRRPAEVGEVEVRALDRGHPDPRVAVFYRLTDSQIRLFGRNEFHAPVQVVVDIKEMRDLDQPPPDQERRFVLPARQEMYLLAFDIAETATRPYLAYRYQYLLGDPAAEHAPERPYRAPFAAARAHRISQAYPYAMTHQGRDAMHAVDIAMPVGTDVYAARGGVVVDVATTNFKGGIDALANGDEANIIRILHDDGTYALYAHLNWNGIRVEPGDVVRRGEYIADSGNTGFSSGPHLHFVVLRNADMRLESVPVRFEGPDGAPVTPELGMELAAY